MLQITTQDMDRLRCYALRLCGDREQVDDLVQQTCLQALHRQHTFDGANKTGWLGTILHNLFINETRRQKVSTLLREQLAYRSVCKPDVEGRLLMQDVLARLEAWPKVKQAVLLYAEGYQYDEIAEQVGVPIGTIKTRIHYARKYLKHLV